MSRRIRKKRLLGLGLFIVCCFYIVQVEVEKSWNKRRKAISIAQPPIKPISIDFDQQRYIGAERRPSSAADDFERHAFNVRTSNGIPADRNIPDTRHKVCNDQLHEIPSTHSASVVISFHNEARSALLRTVVSVLNRTPDALLRDIILVDDASDDASDGSELAVLPKVRVYRNRQRQGLVRSRMFGVRKSSASHVVFLDSHCEVNSDWLAPLLHTLTLHPKALVSPVIDIIDTDTFQYKSSSGLLRGGFDWNLNFRWISDPKPRKELQIPLDYFKSPVIPGGLFIVNRTWFEELGGLDTGLEIWGAENIEVSVKSWLCGGQVLVVPCSRVGHVFRKKHPYTFPPNGSLTIYLQNAKRVAEMWLDDYKYQFYDVKPQAKKLDVGSIEAASVLKQKLKCKPFQWFLDNVYPDLKPLSKDALALGRLQQENLCLERHVSNQNKTSVALAPCSETKSEQEWFFSKSGELQQDQYCMTAKVAVKKPKVYLTKCSNVKEKWSRRRRLLVFHDLCLENAMDKVTGHLYLTLNPCRKNAFSQQWDFSVELQAWGDR